MNILLIGGAGYIGSNVSLLLKNKRPEDFVLILDNFSTGTKQALVPDIEWVCADVRDYNQLNSIFKYKKFDVVMDFSALTVVSESTQKPLEYYEDNFIGTYNILKAMKENNVKNIIFSSTAAVYGNPKEVPIVETSLKDPINPYGNSKLCSEFLIKDAHNAYGINYVIFRYFNVAGASDDYNYGFFRPNPTLLIPALNTAILKDETFHIYGDDYDTKDGTCIRDYIHVVDLANAHLLALDWMIENNASNDFNLGCNSGYSVKEVLDETLKIINKPLDYDYLPRRAGDPAELITNNQKAETVLKWKTTKTLKDMIESDFLFRQKHFEDINK